MCYDQDLFGDVIVTLDDISVWLDTVPHLFGQSKSRRNYYAQYNDIANKIKLSKANGSFEKLIKEAEAAYLYSKSQVDIFKTVYIEDPLEENDLKCPDGFHVCDNPNCAIFVKRIAHEKYAAAYAKRKKAQKLKRAATQTLIES